MKLLTKQRKVAIDELNKKLRLESIFARELSPLFNKMNKEFRTAYALYGRVIDFSRYEAEMSALLKKHYERSQRAFKDAVSVQNEKLFTALQVKQNDTQDLIDLALSQWIDDQLETQPRYIIDTTENDANLSVNQSRASLIDSGQELTTANVAMAAGVFNRRKLFGRMSGITVTATQGAAESTKEITAEAVTGRIPYPLKKDPFELTRPREAPVKDAEKQWITVHDSKVRATHAAADRQTKDIDEAFLVGGFQLRHPGDMSLGSPISETINCRCASMVQIEKL